MSHTRLQISQEYSKLIGIPYESLDCYQLISEFFRLVFGLSFDNFNYGSEYPEKSKVIKMFREEVNSGNFLKVNKPNICDIIVLNISGQPIHVGIYLGDNMMLHTLKGHNSCMEKLGIKWKKRIEGYYRWQNFNHIHLRKTK